MRKTRRPGNMNRAVAYLRVSTDEQHLGPDAQRAAIARWCGANGIELVNVYADLGVSGGAPLEGRPQLLAALVALEQGHAGALLVAKRDRLARDAMTAGIIHREVERLGCRVMAADGMGNGTEPGDVLMRQMLDAFAEYERGMIRARTRAALAVKRRRGEHLGGKYPPYGYRLAADHVRLEPDLNEQEVVALARSLREGGLSLRAVAARLTAGGHLSRSGRPFAASQVARMTTESIDTRGAA